MNNNEKIESYLAEQAIAENTCDRYRRVLRLYLDSNGDLEHVSPLELRSWLMSHPTWGPTMRWLAFAAIKKYLRWSYGENHPALKLKMRRLPSPPQRTLNTDQVRSLLHSFDRTTPKGCRDYALVLLLLDSGLRSSEICRLEIKKLDMKSRKLTVRVKGGEWGQAVFSDDTQAALLDWLKVRMRFVKSGCDTVFISLGGNRPGTAITRHGLQVIMRHWAARVGFAEGLSPHDFRRTFATIATRQGAPEQIVMRAGRWRDAEVFSRYTQSLQPEDLEPYFPSVAVLNYIQKHRQST